MQRFQRHACILLLSVIAVCVAEKSVSARTYYVRTRGNDRNSGTSANSSFKTVARALQQNLTYGDTVYIGAGTYSSGGAVRALANDSFGDGQGGPGQANALLARPLRIVADTTGRFTGDRGNVVVAALNRWAFTVSNNASVQFEGLIFGPSLNDGRYYGVYANGVSASVTVVNCRFQNVYYGGLVYSGRLIASNCDFVGNVYGAYGSNLANGALLNCRFSDAASYAAVLHSHDVLIRNCSFDKSKNGLYVRGVDNKSTIDMNQLAFNECVQGLYCQNSVIVPALESAITTSSCTYGVVLNNCRSEMSGIISRGDTRAVSVYGGEARISRIDVSNSKSYGIYTANMTQLELGNCRFKATESWAVHAHGEKLSIIDSTFDGTKHGLYVRELNQTDAPTLRGLNFSGCSYGLRCDNSPVVVSQDSHLTFSDCAYAITLNSCRSTLQGLDLSGSQRPLNLYQGTAAVDGLVIRTSKSLGVYSSSMDQLSVTNSQFGTTGSWGLYAHGQNLLVEKSEFSGSQQGLYIQETTGKKSPTLNDLTFSKCSGTGLHVASSSITLSKKSNIRVDNCGYGIYLANCTSKISGMTLSSSNIPLYVNGGVCDVDGVTIQKAGTYGLLAYRMLEFSGKNLKCSGARSWGVYGYGQKFSVSDSIVSSCGHGVYIDGQGDKRPIPLANVSIQDNSGYGLYVKDASFEVLPESTLKILRNRGTGLYLSGQRIDLNADSGIEITDNGIGIYANRTDVKMSGFKLNDNGYGILQYYGNLECRDSLISGGRYGIYQFHSPECLIEGTTISGASSWGVVVSNSQAENQKVTLTDSKVVKCGGGVNATMLGDGRLNVSGTTIADNRSHGIYSWRAGSTLTKTTIARNRGYGVLHYDGSVDVSDSTIEDSGSYGLMAYGHQNPGASSIVARRNQVTGNSAGIFAYRVNNAEIVNNVTARNQSYGVAVDVSGKGTAEIWNNSIVDNRYGVWHLGGKGSIRNNIIANGDRKAKNASAYGIYRGGGNVDVGHNLLFGQQRKYINIEPGAGDVLKPPRFVDHAKGDYRLAAGSPAINAGTSPGKLTSVDIQGLSRPMFNAYEIGAFEYPEKSGSLRILDWNEVASPPKSVLINGRLSSSTSFR
tara:strand:- start:162015 stop:165362 length:3348 start_codon:yes stop_codon:yes gene_type:complete